MTLEALYGFVEAKAKRSGSKSRLRVAIAAEAVLWRLMVVFGRAGK